MKKIALLFVIIPGLCLVTVLATAVVCYKPVKTQQLGTPTAVDSEFVVPVGIRVNTDNCPTPPLTGWQAIVKCSQIGEEKIDEHTIVKAFQVVSAKIKTNVDVGSDIYLEFYKNEEKLDIPKQIFHSTWATDYLALWVSFVDENNIWVQVSTPNGDKPYVQTYYFYNGKTWQTQNFSKFGGLDDDYVMLYASSTIIKLVVPRDCYYDPKTDRFLTGGKTDKNPNIYLIEKGSWKVVNGWVATCVAE